MEVTLDVAEATKRLSQNQKSIIKSLSQFGVPVTINFFDSNKTVIVKLQERGLVTIQNEQVSLTLLGISISEFWKNQANETLEPRKTSAKNEALQQERLEKSNHFLELYKQGLSYQDIGDKYGLSRERVRQVLKSNPEFDTYLKEREEAEALSEIEKRESAQKKSYSKSLAALYPERVAELWDCEKNVDLKPEEILAGSTQHSIWFKCSEGHSWDQKPNQIVASWKRNGTSGCPICAGKKKKAERQPSLIDVYSQMIGQYWDYEKNTNFGLDPEIVTLSSNKKAWFKCPQDDNEWQSRIVSIINQQWSKDNAGCRVCNGTSERKRGEWKRSNPIAVEFPDQVAKYWLYDANNELGLDPLKLTSGSSKEAFFKCPDGHEWVATIVAIAKTSWKKGNNGCPSCRGFKSTESTSLISTYPDRVAQYWDYEKNNKAGIYPDKFTRGSTKEAWFKCPDDEYEWKTRIGSITRSSWDQGNSGCARCFGWSIDAIRQFVASLEVHIPNLTQAELYKIFEQSGVLSTQNAQGLKIVKDIIKGKLTGQKLRDVIQGKEIQTSETIDSVDFLNADTELKIADAAPSLSISQASQSVEADSNSQDNFDKSDELPKIKVQKSLEFLNSKIVASADQEAINFFIASKRNRIWAEVFEDESAVAAIEAFTDDGYGRQVRDQFLNEYYQARDMVIPSGWAFRVNGKITPPNLMQKLAAVHLRSQQRMLNLSLTGTGKTIGGILSSRIIDAHLTIIICPLDTISNWHGEIKHVFPDSRVTSEDFNPHWIDIEEGHHYLILNHEKFQQPSTACNIRKLLERYQIDLIIVDEIHRCKQRNGDSSKRRQMVLALITNAAKQNPDLHVLGMSATPVINNLKEGKSLVELVTGVERSDLGEKATINNCMRLHQAFVTLGIRSKVKPKIKIDRVNVPVDCTHLVDRIREEGTSILKMEQILTSARIPAILKELRPKTIVYTH
jgi:hypothetical protein